jgi:DNA mismatch repair protein MutS2
MLHPNDFESRLGFDQIRLKLSERCLSTLGENLVQEISFLTDATAIELLLRQNQEFKQILETGETFPASHYFNPEEQIKKIALEGNYLDEPEFLQLAYSIQTILSCRDSLIKNREKYPSLFELTYPVGLSKQTSQQIFSVIDESGVVKDSASPELSKIRKRLRDEQHRSRRLIDQVYRYAIEQQWVPEGSLPTIREGRLVIPIQAEHKRKLKGFILDESSTGQTVFMEPTEVLEANNEIRDLEHAQRREVIRLLKELTNYLRSQLPELTSAYHFLAKIDFTRAKAKLAIDLDAHLPQLKAAPILKWSKARHPLLYLSLKSKREIVPLTIELTESERMLLVSGPNAGGKSVCLKTVGLLQYMAQCGLLIPLSPDSVVGVFSDIFVDIGDQQSIENDLSTYSSHLKNMAFFLEHASDKSMVLLDELGAGTDPNFGGAIAQSVLSGLLERKVWSVATTHYYNLKLFAGQAHGIRNAAMRFDEEKLLPLFILDIGKPGSSFALEIAHSTGLPQQILNQAKELVGKELVGFETLVRNLEREKNQLSQKVSALEKREYELKNLLAKYEALTSDLEVKKKEIINRAKQEAQVLLKQTNKEIEKTIRHIRENQAQRQETTRVRKNLEELSKKVEQPTEKIKVVPGTIASGDRVRLIGQNGSGVVVSVKGKNAVVQLGEIKTVVNTVKLEKVSGQVKTADAKKSFSTTGIKLHEKQSQFNPTLDVRGKRVEEVVSIVDQFLDNAILLGHGEVRILHGKGEGVLRKVVRERLRAYKQIASFADEHVERGGDGITVIVLK